MPHQPSKLKLTTTIRQVSPLHGRCRSAPMDQKYLPLQSDHVLNRKGTHKITWISRFHAAPWAVLLVQWEDPALQKMWDHWHSADRVQHHFRLWTSPADPKQALHLELLEQPGFMARKWISNGPPFLIKGQKISEKIIEITQPSNFRLYCDHRCRWYPTQSPAPRGWCWNCIQGWPLGVVQRKLRHILGCHDFSMAWCKWWSFPEALKLKWWKW